MSANPNPAIARKRRLSLRLCLSLLLIGVVLAVGAALAIHNYRQTERIVLDAAEDVFRRMGHEVVLELDRRGAPVRLLVDMMSMQGIADATNLDERMRHVPALAEALQRSPALAAIYAGYADGDFFLIRPLRDDLTRTAVRAPPQAAFVAQSIERGLRSGSAAKFVYLRPDLSIIDTVERPDFVFDPRSRGWYDKAMSVAHQVRTEPYVFFTTREPGITFARKMRSDRGVVGADITLTNLSQMLERQPVAQGTRLMVLTDGGQIVARNGAESIAQVDASGALHLASLTAAGGDVAAALARRFAQPARERQFDFNADRADWIGAFVPVNGEEGAPLHLAVAAPADALLEGARRMREQSYLMTLALIAAALPIAWLVASAVSRPLQRLAGDARAMQSFDFAETPPVRSMVREVDQLGAAMTIGKAGIRRFLDISGAFAAERNLQRLISRVLEETMKLAGADAAALHLVDATRGALAPAQYLRTDAAETAASLAPMPPIDLAADAAAPARAAFEGRTILVDLPRDDHAARAWLGDQAERFPDGAIALLATPLRDRSGDVIGVLSLMSASASAATVRPQVVAFIEKLSGVAAVAIETQRLIAEQKALMEAFIQLVAAAIDAKSPYTGGHCQRVPDLTRMLAQAACDTREGPLRDFQLSEDEWEAVRIASWLHDCGKVTTPEYVVDKATKLETLYDRIHEVRMRFEVLKRDAEIAYWTARVEGGDAAALSQRLADELARLDADFAFIASCNEGGESMDASAVDRVKSIAGRTWRRTLDDRLGVSWEERRRKERRPAAPLPADEPLLADAPEHIVFREASERMPDDNPWKFKLAVPAHRYNRGEIHNLTVGRGTLTAEERFKINDHIVQTIIMLEKLPFPRHLRNVPEIAGGHHETMDGRGYPRRLTRDQMSPVARMMAIADIFEALTAVDRPYKKGKTLSEALRIMARMRDDRHVDADLFELFLVSGVYRRYAEKHLRPEQIDEVDVQAFIGRAAQDA